ncbi:MAG: hypothetical protein AAF462_06920 [Thermodesulfobacteriota bacterium]
MKLKTAIYSVLIMFTALLVFSSTGYSQESISLGCCKTVKGTPECVGCGDGEANCAVDGSLCVETNSFTLSQICINSSLAGEAECRPAQGNGCCVEAEAKCSDDVTIDSCSGQHWFEGSSCSDVPSCTPQDSSDFLDTIIIILAVLIVIVLLVLFRRKKPRA